MKRSTPLKRTAFKRSTTPMKRTKLRVAGVSTTADLKKEIQDMLRKIVILRDGGCILRNHSHEITNQYRECGGFRKDGGLILQAEHLHTRSNAASFSDSRLVICICKRHHIYYKPQHADEYYRIVKNHIGKERTQLLERVQNDHRPYKVDLKIELIALEQEYKKLSSDLSTEFEYEQVV
jgi:hypothetical protein